MKLFGVDGILVQQLMKSTSSLLDNATGGPGRPVFYDIDTASPFLRRLEDNYDGIRAELDAILPGYETSFPSYHELDPSQEVISGTTDGKEWKIFMLFAPGAVALEENVQRCPETAKLVAAIPDMTSAFFSILDAGKSVPRHTGPSDGTLRYHLGLRVPKTKPPTIVVAGKPYTWVEREGVLFDDSWEHEVINESDELRVVLIVDFVRPMPAVPHMVFWLLNRTLSPLLYSKAVIKRNRERNDRLGR